MSNGYQPETVDEIEVPVGYGTNSRLVSWSDFLARHFNSSMEPEYARRMKAAFLFAHLELHLQIGIGSGGPRANPHPISPASMRGQSFHQKQRYNDGTWWWTAADLVVWQGGGKANRAPTWDEVQFFELFACHAFIGETTATRSDDEPWHVQPREQRGWGGWVTRGRLRPIPNVEFDVPTEPAPEPTNPPPEPPTNPSKPPTNPNEVEVQVQELVKGKTDNDANLSGQPVLMFQNQASKFFGKSLKLDGVYGSKSEQACKDIQAFFGLKADGRCGPKTWDIVLNMPMNYIN